MPGGAHGPPTTYGVVEVEEAQLPLTRHMQHALTRRVYHVRNAHLFQVGVCHVWGDAHEITIGDIFRSQRHLLALPSRTRVPALVLLAVIDFVALSALVFVAKTILFAES